MWQLIRRALYIKFFATTIVGIEVFLLVIIAFEVRRTLVTPMWCSPWLQLSLQIKFLASPKRWRWTAATCISPADVATLFGIWTVLICLAHVSYMVSQMCRDFFISTSVLITGLSKDILSFNSKWIIDGSKVTSNSLFGHRTIFREMICRKLWCLLLCPLNALEFCWGLPSHSHGFHIRFPFTNRKLSTLKAMLSFFNSVSFIGSRSVSIKLSTYGIWSLRSMLR